VPRRVVKAINCAGGELCRGELCAVNSARRIAGEPDFGALSPNQGVKLGVFFIWKI
jgi:hypothetical protein